MNYYKRHIGDYARDTGHLTALEHGIYGLLLDWYYVNEKPIPDEKAFRIAKANRMETETVLSEFFHKTPEGWIHHYADREIADYRRRSEINTAIGKLGGRPRKTETVSVRKPNANPAISHKPITNKEQKATVRTSSEPSAFDRWWATYPNKQGKEPARKKWASLKLDAHVDSIIEATAKLAAEDDKWLRGFVPMGSTFINQQRWTDEPMAAPLDGNSKPPAKAPPPESFGPAAAMAPSETPLERDLAYCRQRWERGEFETRDSYTEAMKSIRREYSV